MAQNTILIKNASSLAGQLLIATPSVEDPVFTRSVVYLCSHAEDGSMGLIINYPVENLKMKHVFDQFDFDSDRRMADAPIHFGGPVESHRGFVVHTDEFAPEGSIIVQGGVAVSASLGVLQAVAEGRGPHRSMLVLGYAGWGAGQLEKEIEAGSWMVVPATKNIVFEAQNGDKWTRAMETLGIDIGHLSNTVGHA